MPVTQCPNCGYDVRGLPGKTCPECGLILPERAPPGPPRLRWRLIIAGAVIAASTALGAAVTLLPGTPQPWGPLPLTIVFPLFASGSPIMGLAPILGVLFYLALPIMTGRRQVPWWTAAPVGMVLILAWVYFVTDARLGTRCQSWFYVLVCGLIETACSTALVTLWRRSLTKPSFTKLVSWHALASLWLVSYAFPYFGELP